MNDFESVLYARGYRLNEKGEYVKAGGLLQLAQQKPDPGNEPLAASSGEDCCPGFRHVRVTSYRTRLLDERNLWDHYIVDALVKAGLLRDDSPQWCKVEVAQHLVGRKCDERTEVEITESAASP